MADGGAEEAEDRTQAPSERRLQRARDEGQVPLSREVVAACGLAAAALVLSMGMQPLASGLGKRLRDMLVDFGQPGEEALRRAAGAWALGAGPLLGAVAFAGVLGVLLQTGFLLHGKALMPDLARLSPARGLKKVFGPDNAVEALKALVKLGVLAWAAWSAMRGAWPSGQGAMLWEPWTLLERIGRELVHLLLLVLGAQVAIALLDAVWVRRRHGQRLRMSREDLRQEAKESDGDPKVKGRLRQLRQARAKRRMLAQVAQATVVVTNPTHYAVALRYERGKAAAPRIVAKGVDEVAARIREAAAKAGVPLVPNPPLARALHTLPVDAEVPAEHFKAVAEIIAYVWRLRGAR